MKEVEKKKKERNRCSVKLQRKAKEHATEKQKKRRQEEKNTRQERSCLRMLRGTVKLAGLWGLFLLFDSNGTAIVRVAL
jgi:hypothetical protein